MSETYTIKINGGFYVDHKKGYFKRSASAKNARVIEGKGALLSLLHSLYHCDTQLDEIIINRSEISDVAN